MLFCTATGLYSSRELKGLTRHQQRIPGALVHKGEEALHTEALRSKTGATFGWRGSNLGNSLFDYWNERSAAMLEGRDFTSEYNKDMILNQLPRHVKGFKVSLELRKKADRL